MGERRQSHPGFKAEAVRLVRQEDMSQTRVARSGHLRGQYTSASYQRRLEQLGAAVSMGRRGNCWDNAPGGVVLRFAEAGAAAPSELELAGRGAIGTERRHPSLLQPEPSPHPQRPAQPG